MKRDAADKGLISGVYNYCDRWCERCPLTARCLSFHTERRRGAAQNAGSRDLDNERFWDGLALAFAATLRMIRRDAKKRGIDLESPELRAEVEREERNRSRAAARAGSALQRSTTAYWKAGKKLLEALAPALKETDCALASEARLGVGQPESTAAAIRDALEVVQWYLFFIEVKLHRAVSSSTDERREKIDGFPRDSDGSAKVALIAIDRSIGAWAHLREHFSVEHGDAILDLLVKLERLRRAAEAKFPKARTFRRPGFD
jgi:hypothetical protein